MTARLTLALCPPGDCHDQRFAGAHGEDGECLQPGHPQHYLRSPAGLRPGDTAGAIAASSSEEKECPYQVRPWMGLIRDATGLIIGLEEDCKMGSLYPQS